MCEVKVDVMYLLLLTCAVLSGGGRVVPRGQRRHGDGGVRARHRAGPRAVPRGTQRGTQGHAPARRGRRLPGRDARIHRRGNILVQFIIIISAYRRLYCST